MVLKLKQKIGHKELPNKKKDKNGILFLKNKKYDKQINSLFKMT